MKLCLVRHAIAEERGPRWPDDGLRPLSAEGEAKMRDAARGLAGMVTPGVILTSPLVRARQTAAIVAEAFDPQPPIVVCEALVTGAHAALLADARATGAECAVAVGHEPSISGALSWLLTDDAVAFASVFKKGGAALVDCGEARDGGAVLEWHLQPAALRAIAAAPTHN